jgi:hypothetical protein
MKLATHLLLILRISIVELYVHSPMCLHDIVPFFFLLSGVGLTAPGTAATSGLLYSPR